MICNLRGSGRWRGNTATGAGESSVAAINVSARTRSGRSIPILVAGDVGLLTTESNKRSVAAACSNRFRAIIAVVGSTVTRTSLLVVGSRVIACGDHVESTRVTTNSITESWPANLGAVSCDDALHAANPEIATRCIRHEAVSERFVRRIGSIIVWQINNLAQASSLSY